MALNRELVMALLIEYDVEHPQTIGEMADRRAIYAERIVKMSEDADISAMTPVKITAVIGDGHSTHYQVSHPFGKRTDIFVRLYDDIGYELVGSPPDFHDGYVEYAFTHAIPEGARRVVIIG